MTSLPNGDYIIYSRALSSTGEKLALSSNGVNQLASVKPLGYTQDQIWTLTSLAGAYTVVPKNGPGLQAAWGGPAVQILTAGNYIWAFTSDSDGFVIQDSKQTVFWGVTTPTTGSQVTITSDNGQPGFRWVVQQL